MSINIGSIARGIQNQVNDLNIDSRIKNVANITVQNLAKAQDLLSVATGPFAGLKAARSIMNPRAAFPTPATSFSPTSVSNASRTLAAGARTALPESQVDGTITTYPGASSTPKVYLINGIATDQAGRDSIGLATAAQTGRNVNLINNSTEGAVKDLLECVEQLIFGKASKPSQKLADEIVNNLTKNPPEKMDLIGFSQGTIMVTHGVSLAINRLKNMGYSDDQIKSMMSQNVTVKLVGTPVDVT
ncbi:MAG: hypothetical protein JNN15_16760, partial [Blastocatellia bacterium]|nr:hypothetical protein [Blastocatellia bacterium]